MRRAIVFCLGASSLVLGIVPSWGAQWLVTFKTTDYPGAAWTMVHGISSPVGIALQPSNIVGEYFDVRGLNGFLLSRGRYTTIDVPTGGTVNSTEPWGVNAQGQIVGKYVDFNGFTRAFLGIAGTFTQLCGDVTAEAHGINNGGTIVGRGVQIPGTRFQAFVISPSNPRVCQYYGFGPIGSKESEANGVNTAGQIVGDYLDQKGVRHGYFWNTRTQFDVPGAVYPGTRIFGINDAGYVVGSYNGQGFLYDKQNVTNIKVPGAQGTVATGINNGNARGFSIVGYYTDAHTTLHGFVASVTLPLATATRP